MGGRVTETGTELLCETDCLTLVSTINGRDTPSKFTLTQGQETVFCRPGSIPTVEIGPGIYSLCMSTRVGRLDTDRVNVGNISYLYFIYKRHHWMVL